MLQGRVLQTIEYGEDLRMKFFPSKQKLLDGDMEARKKEEADADEYAKEIMEQMCKQINMEPVFSETIDYWIDFYWSGQSQCIKDNFDAMKAGKPTDVDEDQIAEDIEWLNNQINMAKNNWSFLRPAENDGEEDVYFLTFKEYMQFAYGAAHDDEEWSMEPLGVALKFIQDPIPEPAASTISDQPVLVTPPVTNTTQTEEVDYVDYTDDFDNMVESAPYIPNGVPSTPVQNTTAIPTTAIPTTSTITPTITTAIPTTTIPTIAADQMPKAPAPIPTSVPQAPTHMGTNQAAIVPGLNTYPPLNITDSEMGAIMKGLYLKLFAHIFNECGFNGRNYTNGFKIATPIQLTASENMVVKYMVCYDANGQIHMKQPVDQWVSGIFINKANTLPGYDLTLATPEGHEVRRKLITQDPDKEKSKGELSWSAQKAREGNQIIWIVDPDREDKQYAVRIFNGVMQSNHGGGWIDV